MTYATRIEAETAARAMNAARTNTKVGYVAMEKFDYEGGKMVCIGYEVGACSDD